MKHKKLFAVLTLVCFMFTLVPMTAMATTDSGSTPTTPVTPEEIVPDYSWYGDGTATEFSINSVEQLAGLAKLTQNNVTVNGKTLTKTNFADKTVKLGTNLTFVDDQYWYYNDGNGKVYDYRINTFAGAFDGGNHTITGLKFYSNAYQATTEVGLIHTVTADGCVNNLKIDTVRADFTNCTKHGNRNKFGAVAYSMNGKAENCHVNGVIVNSEAGTFTDGKEYGYTSHTGSMFGVISGVAAAVTSSSAYDIKIIVTGVDNGESVGGFAGVINGGASVSNCTIEKVKLDCTNKLKGYGGFVGYSKNATLTDCTATNLEFDIDNYYYLTGGFVGWAQDDSVYKNCDVNGFKMYDNVTSTIGGDVGGFVGYASGSGISFTDCNITDLDLDLEFANDDGFGVGGFAGGLSNDVTVTKCSASGNITATGTGKSDIPVGGFIGEASGALKVNDCTTEVNVTAPDTAGGFVGACNGGNGEFTKCESTGSVTSTDGIAGGMVGYVKSDANPTFGEGCIPAISVNGPIKNPIANALDKEYEIDADGKISVESSDVTGYKCYGKSGGYNLGYNSIQEAVNAGAITVTLLQDLEENFIIDEEENTDFTLNLGTHKLESTITVHHKIHSIAFNADTGNVSEILLTDPEGAHSVFEGWCSGSGGEYKLATKDTETGHWIVVPGTTYHTHYVPSGLTELPEETRHLTIPRAQYGYVVGTAMTRKFTFEVSNEAPDNFSARIVAFEETEYFDVAVDETNSLAAIIKPKAGLDAGKYSEKIYVFVEEDVATQEGANHTSSHELFVDFEVTKADSAVKPGTSKPEENGVYVYAYGDVIEFKAKVAKADVMMFALDVAEDTVAFYCDDVLLDTVDVDYEDETHTSGTATLAYDTTQGGILIGTEQTIVAVYGGSVNLNGSQSDKIKITLTARELAGGETFNVGETTITGPATIDPENVTVEADGKIGDIVVPADTTITVPADKLTEVTTDIDGNIVLPEGATVVTGSGNTVVVPDDNDAATNNTVLVNPEDGSVTIPAGSKAEVTLQDGTTIFVTGPAAMDSEGKVTIKDGGSAVVDGATVTGPAYIETNENGKLEVTIEGDGTITTEDGTVVKAPAGSSITVPADKLSEVTTDSKGNIVLPSGSVVTKGDTVTKLPYGGSINENGTVTVNPAPSTGGGFSGVYNYQVAVVQPSNGTITLSESNAVKGETVIVTATPNNGYGTSAVIVTDGDGDTIAVTDLQNGTYSFVMPEGKVSVTAVFKDAIVLKIGDNNMNVFGKTVANDVAPQIKDDYTMLPIRPVVEALDGDVAWDADTQKITVKLNGNTVVMYVGEKVGYINGVATQMDVPSYIDNSRAFYQLRFVAEATGTDIHWNKATYEVTLIPE